MTVRDLIYDSLRLVGVMEVGQGQGNDENVELLRALNNMIDAWRTERLMAYTIASTPYTVSPDGTVQIPHAVQIVGVWIVGETLLVETELQTNQTQYDGGVYSDQAYPVSTLTFTPPIPAGTNVLVETWVDLLSFGSIDQTVSLPQGYVEAMTYNLALRVAPRYRDAIVSPLVVQTAMKSIADIKRMNAQTPLMTIDRALLGGTNYGVAGFSGFVPRTP